MKSVWDIFKLTAHHKNTDGIQISSRDIKILKQSERKKKINKNSAKAISILLGNWEKETAFYEQIMFPYIVMIVLDLLFSRNWATAVGWHKTYKINGA